MIKRFTLALLILWFYNMAGAQAQQSQKDVFYVDLNTGFSLINNSFTEMWDPAPAAQLNIRIPYHATQLEVGLRYTRFEGDAPSDEDSDFQSFFFHLGFNYQIRVTQDYHIAPTLRVGNNFMIFNESAVFTNNSGTERFVTDQAESEFSYELALQNHINLSDKWSVNATISYNRTLTFYPLRVTLFSVGITRSFSQPFWFKKFIK